MRRSLCLAIGLLGLTAGSAAAQVTVTGTSPSKLLLEAGGSPLTLTIEGVDLTAVTDVRVLRSGSTVADVRATIQTTRTVRAPRGRTVSKGTPLVLSLEADGSAQEGRYDLQLLAGRQSIDVPTRISVVVATAVTSASPSQVALEASGAAATVALSGRGLDAVTEAWVERSGTRMDGRVEARLQPSSDPTRLDVELVAYANAGPPWGGTMQLVLHGSAGSAGTMTAPVAVTVPAPPVDLVISSCAFDSTAPLRRVARATLTNNGSEGATFQSGQALAHARGVGPDRTIDAPGGGRFLGPGQSLEVSTNLDLTSVQPGTLALTWAADPDDLVLESNAQNNSTWCPFELAPPPPEPEDPVEALPDLIISSLTVEPNTGPPSTEFVIKAVYRNVGPAPTARIGPTVHGDAPYLHQFRPSCTINGAPVYISEAEDYWWVSPMGQIVSDPYGYVGLGLGQSGTMALRLPAGMAPGAKTLECTLGYPEPEVTKTNNSATRVFTIGNP